MQCLFCKIGENYGYTYKKQVKTKTIHKRMNLPQSLRDKIDEFWKKQVKVNPNLFNGEVWNVTKMEENKDNILLTIEKQTMHITYMMKGMV